MENEKINVSEAQVEETVSAPEETVTHEQTLKLMSPMQMVVRRFFRSKLSIIGLIMIIVAVIIVIIASGRRAKV